MGKKRKSVVAALIVAAGSGTRMERSIPKQFIKLNEKPILRYTLEKFQTCNDIDQIYVILPDEYVKAYRDIFVKKWRISKFTKAVAGGEERHLSVWAGLQALAADVEIVLIHDGVRPFVTHRILKESIAAAELYGAAVVGLMPKDTVKLVRDNKVEKTLDRRDVIFAQTPQTFERDVIVKANMLAFEKKSFSTDDAALVEQSGRTVAVVPGDWKNFKITSPEDLILAKAILEEGGGCA